MARPFPQSLDDPIIPAKRGGGKLGRSETVTVRLDPKLNYLCELAARAQRRTKSSFIEWAVADSLNSVPLPDVVTGTSFDDVHQTMLSEKISELWHVDEPDRVVALALLSPALLTHEEQLIWKHVRECGYLWRGHYDRNNEWVWSPSEGALIRDRLRENWETFKAVSVGDRPSSALPTWIKKKPSSDDDVPF